METLLLNPREPDPNKKKIVLINKKGQVILKKEVKYGKHTDAATNNKA